MSRQEIIRRIVDRERAALSLTEEAVIDDDGPLHEAACNAFGTWKTALQYAGIHLRRPRVDVEPEFTPEGVVRMVRHLCVNGCNLTSTCNRYRYPRLYSAAGRYFGTWRRALAATGIDPHHVSMRRQMSRAEIIKALQRRHRSGQSLVWADACLENRALAVKARNAYRTWRKALQAAGIDPDKYRAADRLAQYRQDIVDGIRKRRDQGKSLAIVDVRRDDAALICAARRYFGSWDRAVGAADT